MRKFFKKHLPFIIVLLFVSLHLPFLNYDPDIIVDKNTRGVWTDEGLYTSQIRNLIDNGHFEIYENSTFIRGPLFNILQFPFFLLLGTSLLVSRMIVLVFTGFVLFLFISNKKLKFFGLFLFLFVLMEFHIFQFSHYGLSELVCLDLILLSLFAFLKIADITDYKEKKRFVFLSSLLMFFCYSCKIQFLYIAAVLPSVLFVLSVMNVVNEKEINRNNCRLCLWAVAYSVLFAGIYSLIWYLPQKEFYDYIMSNETGSRFPQTWADLKIMIVANYSYRILTNEFIVPLLHFYLTLIVLVILVFSNKKLLLHHRMIILFALVWLFWELHKIPMNYLPNRYMLSAIFAIGVFISALYSELYYRTDKLKILLLVIAFSFGAYNFYNYSCAYNRRTNQLQEVNNYLSSYNLKGQTVIGAWAPSVCWKSKAITFPVWNNYFNSDNVLRKYQPRLIVTELNEDDSNQAYSSRGINLKEVSDSCRIFRVWRYDLALYWINKETVK